MTAAELEAKIAELRAQPLRVLCRLPNGKQRVMTVREYFTTGSEYIHVVADDLDQLLDDAINNTDAAQPPQKG